MSQPGWATGPHPQFLTPMSPLMSPGPSGLRSPALKSSKPTSLFLKKTLIGNNGSSSSINEMPPPPTPTGLRAQLGHLLPRHAYFRAHVVIHQISSVPFVGGEFAVRWKFKGVQNAQHSKQKQRLLGRGKGRADTRLVGDDLKSPDDGLFSPQGPNSDLTTVTTLKQNPFDSLSSTSSSRASDQVSDATTLTTEWGHLSVSATAASSASSLSTTIPIPNSSRTSTPVITDPGSVTPARGSTPYLPLKDHSVIWSQSLDTILKFDIDRETSYILTNPLKLVVVQRVVPDDPHGNPQNPRLGAVYLNLSEYVGQGNVNRRYLLKESKTNAILKLTIGLEFLSGEANYIPPPLAKGEILNGIAGFLEKDSVKKRPRPLDLYGPYKNQEELETDLLSGLKSTARAPKTARSERKVFDIAFNSTTETENEDDESQSHDTTSFEEAETGDEVNVAFDFQRLPAAYGTKTTEMLIESLFNPVRVSDKTEESPFTIYEPPSPDNSPPRLSHVTSKVGRIGLGIPHDSNTTAILPSRQNSFTAEETYSMHTTTTTTTTSDSASELSHHTSSSLHGRSLETGRLRAQKAMANARSTPGGRVIIEGHGRVSSEDLTSSSIDVVRSWWKRNISKHNLTITKTHNNQS